MGMRNVIRGYFYSYNISVAITIDLYFFARTRKYLKQDLKIGLSCLGREIKMNDF